jgi:hypothetical protein
MKVIGSNVSKGPLYRAGTTLSPGVERIRYPAEISTTFVHHRMEHIFGARELAQRGLIVGSFLSMEPFHVRSKLWMLPAGSKIPEQLVLIPLGQHAFFLPSVDMPKRKWVEACKAFSGAPGWQLVPDLEVPRVPRPLPFIATGGVLDALFDSFAHYVRHLEKLYGADEQRNADLDNEIQSLLMKLDYMHARMPKQGQANRELGGKMIVPLPLKKSNGAQNVALHSRNYQSPTTLDAIAHYRVHLQKTLTDRMKQNGTLLPWEGEDLAALVSVLAQFRLYNTGFLSNVA